MVITTAIMASIITASPIINDSGFTKYLNEQRQAEQQQVIVEKSKPKYRSLGTMRISTYCEHCNDPAGRQTSTGQTPYTGSCAGPSWLLGQTVYIEGEPFYVNDICGCDNTIDIWCEGDCGENYLAYKEVILKVR